MRMIQMGLMAGVVGILAASAQAAVFSIDGKTYTTQFNVGTGDNKSMMVLEYGQTDYLFGFSWSGAASGTDMLYAIRDASGGALTVDFQTFTFPDGNGGFISSDFIKTISYTAAHQVTYDEDTSYFNYFISDDGANWTAPFDFGASGRSLTNGAWDDWVYETTPALPPDFDPPATPTFSSAAPEPMSISLLGVGGMLLLRRRR